MSDFFEQVLKTAASFDLLELSGLIFGILTVWFLIKQSIWTWPFGILYILVSFVVFWNARLFGDLILHIFFLILNIYGWYYWIYGKKEEDSFLKITTLKIGQSVLIFTITLLSIYVFGFFLIQLPKYIENFPSPSLPYWDASTSMLSVTAMWLTAKKKIENWHYWFVVDVLATGIYIYKTLYFYSLLYFIYIIMAVLGYLAWKKTLSIQSEN